MVDTKKLLTLLMALPLVIFTSCNNDEQEPKPRNYVQLSVAESTGGSTSIGEDTTEPVIVDVLLAHTLEKDETITFLLQDNEEEILRIEGNPMVIKKGGKRGSIKIYSNNKNILLVQRNITLKASFSDNNMELQKEWVFNVKPSTNLPQLTTEQQRMIADYKTKYGIDVYRMLGKLNCQVTIKFSSAGDPADKDAYNNGKVERIIDGTSIITLSQKATADKPILKMINNPMGLNDFLYEMMRKMTTEQEEWCNPGNPQPSAIMKALGYVLENGFYNIKGKETFETQLDGIELSPFDKNIYFVGDKATYAYPDDFIKAVPFEYDFSLWNKLLTMKDKEVPVATGEDEQGNIKYENMLISDMFSQAGSLDPRTFLFYSGNDSDEYKNKPSDYIAPGASYDFDKGVFSFVFPFDASLFSGYAQITVTYTMRK